MKRHILFLIAVGIVGLFAAPAHEAQASRPKVRCDFSWNNNAALNVHSGTRTHIRKVRTAEYNRLVGMGTVPARSSANGGQWCQLNHPENTLVDVSIRKDTYKLDPAGRVPSCSDFGAMVTCRGI